MSLAEPPRTYEPFLRVKADRPKIGVYGGTFDPPHVGHLDLVFNAYKTLGLDEIWVIPNGSPPGKQPVASIEDRIRWCRLTFADIPNVTVYDIEARPSSGPHLTWNTLALIQGSRPEAQLTLLMGMDQYENFDKWKHPEIIARYADLAVMKRSDKSSTSAREALARLDYKAAGQMLHPNVLRELTASNPYFGPRSS